MSAPNCVKTGQLVNIKCSHGQRGTLKRSFLSLTKESRLKMQIIRVYLERESKTWSQTSVSVISTDYDRVTKYVQRLQLWRDYPRNTVFRLACSCFVKKKKRTPSLCSRKRRDAGGKSKHDTRRTSLLFHNSVRLLITVCGGRRMLLCLFCMTSEERGPSSCRFAFRQRVRFKYTACFMKPSCISIFWGGGGIIFGIVNFFAFSFPNLRFLCSEAYRQHPSDCP